MLATKSDLNTATGKSNNSPLHSSVIDNNEYKGSGSKSFIQKDKSLNLRFFNKVTKNNNSYATFFLLAASFSSCFIESIAARAAIFNISETDAPICTI